MSNLTHHEHELDRLSVAAAVAFGIYLELSDAACLAHAKYQAAEKTRAEAFENLISDRKKNHET